MNKKKVRPTKKAKKAVKKPAKKKTAPKAKAKVQSMAMVTVPIEQIQKVETYKGRMSVIPTPLTGPQIMQLVAPTPRNVVLKRPGKGGKEFDYIPGWYFKKKLNFVFGWMHDFEILGERIDGDFVTVKGKLTVKDKTGKPMISKTDFGGHPIQYIKGTKQYVDISNDFKAASTDCLKRCAVQLGIGLDVYSAGEYTNPSQPEAPAEGPVVAKQASEVVQDAPKSSKTVTVEAKAVKTTDYAAKLEEGLKKRGLKSMADKKKYITRVAGLSAAYTYEQGIKNGMKQREAQSLIGQILNGEAKGK